ncbi:uncharacterized protein VP01_2686g1 [Puccinia sorghi]|uniref:Myb/SANT-like domain-containing protein n=1 Tax=Puccinia sorghi TaxID=27349 RepID=A0A0L6V3S0_9BASI|nr:uncharacterized protein VP01_2686g1 [Puccinia sorghi]
MDPLQSGWRSLGFVFVFFFHHPDNLVVLVPANSQTRTQKKLMWSGPMEMIILDLYAEEVSKGRKADSGFQTFAQVEHVLNANKVKSKLSQGFKKFGWDKISCEVTASDAVWNKFLLSHPNAKKFQGTPFPEFRKLEIIFGFSGTTREAACFANSSLSGMDPNLTSADESESRNAAVTYQISTNTSPSSYLSRSHTKKDSIAVAIESLVGFLISQQTKNKHSTGDGAVSRGPCTTHFKGRLLSGLQDFPQRYQRSNFHQHHQ